MGHGLFTLCGLPMRLRLDACSCASPCILLGGYIVDERVNKSPLSFFGFATWLALSVCGLREWGVRVDGSHLYRLGLPSRRVTHS